MMTREEAIAKLTLLAKEENFEQAHLDSHVIINDLLISLGYQDVVDAYYKVRHWYE